MQPLVIDDAAQWSNVRYRRSAQEPGDARAILFVRHLLHLESGPAVWRDAVQGEVTRADPSARHFQIRHQDLDGVADDDQERHGRPQSADEGQMQQARRITLDDHRRTAVVRPVPRVYAEHRTEYVPASLEVSLAGILWSSGTLAEQHRDEARLRDADHAIAGTQDVRQQCRAAPRHVEDDTRRLGGGEIPGVVEQRSHVRHSFARGGTKRSQLADGLVHEWRRLPPRTELDPSDIEGALAEGQADRQPSVERLRDSRHGCT